MLDFESRRKSAVIVIGAAIGAVVTVTIAVIIDLTVVCALSVEGVDLCSPCWSCPLVHI